MKKKKKLKKIFKRRSKKRSLKKKKKIKKVFKRKILRKKTKRKKFKFKLKETKKSNLILSRILIKIRPPSFTSIFSYISRPIFEAYYNFQRERKQKLLKIQERIARDAARQKKETMVSRFQKKK